MRVKRRTRGFTLVECLVALVVLSMGLLGAAAMLLGSLRGQSAALRAFAATGLARDMADRILANRGAGAAYSGGSDAAPDACALVPCSPAERAAADLAFFLAASGVQGELTFVPAIGPAALDRYVIRVSFIAQDGVRDSIVMSLLAQPVAG
jgi:type IV pilus assembly protein PilV